MNWNDSLLLKMMTHQKVRDVSVQLFAQKCVTVKFTIFLQVLSFLRYGLGPENDLIRTKGHFLFQF